MHYFTQDLSLQVYPCTRLLRIVQTEGQWKHIDIYQYPKAHIALGPVKILHKNVNVCKEGYRSSNDAVEF